MAVGLVVRGLGFGPGGSMPGRHEPRHGDDEGDDADPDVDPEPGDAAGRVDPQRFDPEPAQGVAGNVEGEQPPGPSVGAASFVQDEEAREREVPERLVEARRVVRGDVLEAGGPVVRADAQAPGQPGRTAEQFLVEPVAEPAARSTSPIPHWSTWPTSPTT